MKKILIYIFPAIGIMAVMIFCVSASSSFAGSGTMMIRSFAEPLNLLLVGVGMIGFGSFIKRKNIR